MGLLDMDATWSLEVDNAVEHGPDKLERSLTFFYAYNKSNTKNRKGIRDKNTCER